MSLLQRLKLAGLAIFQAALLLALWVGLLFALGALVSWAWKKTPSPYLVLSEFGAAAILAVLIYSQLFPGQPWVREFIARVNLKDSLLAGLAALATVACALILARFSSYVLPCTNCASPPQYASLFGGQFVAGFIEQIWTSAIFLTLFVLLCRGRTWAPTLLLALLFMKLHAPQMRADGWHVLRFVLAGAVLARITFWGRSIWPAAVFHGVLNGAIAVLLAGEPGANPLFATTPEGPALLEMVPLAVLLAGFAWVDVRARLKPGGRLAANAATDLPVPGTV